MSENYRRCLAFILLLSPSILTSCLALGYDNHLKPIPKQEGKAFILQYSANTNAVKVRLKEIVSPVNHESGWDQDDVVLVFQSPLIKEDEFQKWYWTSQSKWTCFRLKAKPPFGYGNAFSARITNGEIRVYCGSKGQFLVNLQTIYLIYD